MNSRNKALGLTLFGLGTLGIIYLASRAKKFDPWSYAVYIPEENAYCITGMSYSHALMDVEAGKITGEQFDQIKALFGTCRLEA